MLTRRKYGGGVGGGGNVLVFLGVIWNLDTRRRVKYLISAGMRRLNLNDIIVTLILLQPLPKLDAYVA